MHKLHLKAIRRQVLQRLYQEYLNDPLNMLEPEDFFKMDITAKDLAPAAHYLGDRGLIELMIGYRPPLFSSVRIRPTGIDLVENHYQFNLLFPAKPEPREGELDALPHLIESLVEEADISPANGIVRQRLLCDVQYLRDELSRPVQYWRKPVLMAVLDWIDAACNAPEETLPSAGKIRKLLAPLAEARAQP